MVWEAVTDFADDAVKAVGGFFSSGGGEAAVNASTYGVPEAIQAGSSSGNLFASAANFAGSAFDWIEDYPNSANLLGGVAMGVGSAYSAAKDREMQRELQRERLAAEQVVPGEMPGGYGDYREGVTRGLISDGLIASASEEDR